MSGLQIWFYFGAPVTLAIAGYLYRAKKNALERLLAPRARRYVQ
jgi:hypothetical protein